MQVKNLSDRWVLSHWGWKAYEWTDFLRVIESQYPHIPQKVAWRKVERLVDRGYLDYGTSINTCWLTPEGLQYKQELEIRACLTILVIPAPGATTRSESS